MDLPPARIVAVIFLYLEELRHVPPTLFVQTITGVAVRERIPERVIDDADEIDVVDITPHALRQRMQHGNIYPPERAQQALRRFFREGNLGALRELSLRRAATTVERQLEEYMHDHEVKGVWPAASPSSSGSPRTRAPSTSSAGRRASPPARKRTSSRCSWKRRSGPALRPRRTKRALQHNLRFAEDLGAEIVGSRTGTSAGPREDRRRPERRHDRRRPSALGAPQGPAVRIPRA